jgi:malonate transporter and related proteins
LDVFFITLPIFALIGVGWGGVRLGLFDTHVGTGLSRFVFWLAFPALLLTSMAKAPPPDGAMTGHILIWLGVLLIAQVLARFLAIGLGFDAKGQAGIALASTCGNTAFLGTAVLTSLVGPSILPLVAAFVAVENIIVVGLAVAALKQAGAAHASFTKMAQTIASGLANPTSIGALLGFLLSIFAVVVPPPLMRPLEMLGSAASPAGLVALGIVMAGLSVDLRASWRGTALVVFFKNLAVPLAMFAAFSAGGAPGTVTLAATLLAACPSAVNVFIQARQANVWAQEAATAVFVTTLVSILGVSLVAGLGLQ